MPRKSLKSKLMRSKFRQYRLSGSRYRSGVKGQGGYYDVMNKYVKPYTKGYTAKFGSSLGGLLGYKYAGTPGSIVGRKAGSYIGQKIGNVLGFGDYALDRNSIVSDPPKMHNIPEGIRIAHREYISDVTSSINFLNLQQLPINPGMAISFPWLSGVAQNFQQYRINGLIFEFITTSGNATGANTALGEVILSTDYNAADDPFVTKQQMLNQEFATAGVPSSNLMHAVECARYHTANNLYYIRQGNVPVGEDLRLYDLGLFQLAVQGQQAGNINLGELWCTYDISFYKPSIGVDSLAPEDLAAHYQLNLPVNAAPLGSSQVKKYDSIGCTFNAAGTVINLSSNLPVASYYMMIWQVTGAQTAALASAGLTFTGGLSPINVFNGDLQSNLFSPAPVAPGSSTTATLIAFFVCNLQSGNNTIEFNAGFSIPGAVTGADVFIMQCPFTS